MQNLPLKTDLARKSSGIISSSSPKGWLAKRWLSGLSQSDGKLATRMARGKTFARNGRVRDLWFSPGLATAEVDDSGTTYRVSIRLRIFETAEWETVLHTLSQQLTLVAELIEGELPKALLTALDTRDLSLLPTPDDLDGDCDCGDYMMPCMHMAAVHQVLADALDGEPFLLFTLRGWDRDRLLATLRHSWGDTHDLGAHKRYDSSPPPKGDWLLSPRQLGRMHYDASEPEAGALGLNALGPAPDGADLNRALDPLYEAGSKAAQVLFMSESTTAVSSKHTHAILPRDTTPPTPTTTEATMSKAESLTERIIDELVKTDCARSIDIAAIIGESKLAVRNELIELEVLGIVTRTGRTRGTRWWIG